MDYTVIENQRQHFGDDPGGLPGIFAGSNKNFSFDCPGIDSSQVSVLMFQSLNVGVEGNIFTINGATIFGGLPVTGDTEAWTGNVALVSPNTLRREDNVLRVEARNESGGQSGDLDDFVIDNIVIFYKTV